MLLYYSIIIIIVIVVAIVSSSYTCSPLHVRPIHHKRNISVKLSNQDASYLSLLRADIQLVLTRDHTILPAPALLSTCRMSHSAFTPQPQSITALWTVLISRPTWWRRLNWPAWLATVHTKMVYTCLKKEFISVQPSSIYSIFVDAPSDTTATPNRPSPPGRILVIHWCV